MLKVFSFVMLVLFAFVAKAQDTNLETIPKNYVGINLGGMFATNKISTNRQTKLMLNGAPFYGRRLKKFVIGITTSIGYSLNKIPQNSYTSSATYYTTEKSYEILLSPTLRYYTKYNIFFSGLFHIGRGRGENSYPVLNAREIYYYNSNFNSSIMGGTLGIGYAIKAGKSFLIEPQISVQKIYSELNYSIYTSSYSIYYSNFNYKTKSNYLNLLIGIGTTYRF
jgi:hypothetical protein